MARVNPTLAIGRVDSLVVALRARPLGLSYPLARRGHAPQAIRRVNARRAAPKGLGAGDASQMIRAAHADRSLLCVSKDELLSWVCRERPSPPVSRQVRKWKPLWLAHRD